jgi:hypothetical protein
LTVTSRPEGQDVVIGGIARGKTPVRLTLPAGQHVIEVGPAGSARAVPVTVEPGVVVAQYVEMAAEPDPGTRGRLEVTSDPPGAQVSIDGVSRGTTPLTVSDITAGPHRVVITRAGSVITRNITIAPGTTATLVASEAPVSASAAAGWIAFTAPIELQIFEGNRLVGSTATERLMLPAGRHELELVNKALEFQRTVTVQVNPGATVTTPVSMPNGLLSINALPWADVSIDGRALGTTPFANLAVPVGPHEVVWRHPQHGERRQTVSVRAQTPTRIGVDFNQ